MTSDLYYIKMGEFYEQLAVRIITPLFSRFWNPRYTIRKSRIYPKRFVYYKRS